MCIVCESKIEDNGYKKLQGLKEIYCLGCSELTYVPKIESLEYLNCDGCVNLKEISFLRNLEFLDCYDCRLLTIFPESPDMKGFCSDPLPWLPNIFNIDLPTNVEKLVTLQRLFKRWLPFLRLRRFIKSREFAEWYYHPKNRGGIVSKRIIESSISEVQQKKRIKMKS